MAFTLESAVAASAGFYILIHSLGLSLPVADDVRFSAEIVGRSNTAVQTEEKFYECSFYEYEGEYLPLLKSSPQRMIELVSLAHDLSLFFRSDG
ncbi:MAG: hypothetical protein GX034_05195 [Clostridiaceae bacterium]|jgi:hypothetical protein|nr:hypothetical protein [Clostridiaceae bacterium]